MSKTSLRNPGLDSLRGIFALIVVVSHVEYIRQFLGYISHGLHPVFYHSGRIAVSGFFVLSGFLITNNLLKIKNSALPDSRKLWTFYLKRALRILPLYYTVILLSYYLFSKIGMLHYNIPPGIHDARVEPGTMKYYYLMLPQIALAKRIILPFAEPTWSIGVEEIFYITVPLFLLLLPFRKSWLLWIASVFVAIKLFYWLFVPGFFDDTLFTVFLFCRFECILVGCYAGYLYYEKNAVLDRLKRHYVYYALLPVIVFAFMMGIRSFLYIQFSICFAVVVLIVAREKFKLLENRFLVFIGKISFSLYLTHEVVVVFILKTKGLASPVKHTSVLTYLVIVFCAILLGWLFYKLIEEPFLKLKDKIGR